jgi:DNA-binding response OmpR family regulator
MQTHSSFVLAIDRDQSYATSLEFALKSEGYAYRHVNDFRAAMPCLTDPNCRAVVIGRNLEGTSGLQLTKILRNESSTSTLIIILVAQMYDEYDVIEGLDAGADDYMGKPLASRELVYRFKAILRRRKKVAKEPAPPTAIQKIAQKVLALNSDDATAIFDGKPLRFTRYEFEILQCMAQSPDRVFPRDQLLSLLPVGETSHRAGENLRKIDVHIRRIRAELDKLENGPVIRTVRGEGYFLSKMSSD